MRALLSLYFHYECSHSLCSTRTLRLNLNQPATWHIRKCSYQPNTEKLLRLGRQRDGGTLTVCHVAILTNSLWHTVIERWRQTVLPEKMIIHKWFQWEEVFRNKRHFYDFGCGKIGVHAEVRPVLARGHSQWLVTYSSCGLLLIFSWRRHWKD